MDGSCQSVLQLDKILLFRVSCRGKGELCHNGPGFGSGMYSQAALNRADLG